MQRMIKTDIKLNRKWKRPNLMHQPQPIKELRLVQYQLNIIKLYEYQLPLNFGLQKLLIVFVLVISYSYPEW